MWRIKILFCCLFIFLSYTSFAQEEKNPSDKNREFFTVAPRLGLGFHNYTNFEIGVSGLYVVNEDLMFGAASIYSTYIFQQSEWSPEYNIKGVKFGFQSSWAIFMWGVEYKRLKYENSYYNYLSPKTGLSLMDVINVEYAINLMEYKINKQIPIASRHQISINFSINRKLYKNVFKTYFD